MAFHMGAFDRGYQNQGGGLLTGGGDWPVTIDSKRATGRQRKTVMDWISAACGDKWNINEILKICRDRNEHLLLATVRV